MLDVYGVELKVSSNRVPLKSAPDENAGIVTHVSESDILVADKDVDGEWIQVVPPDRLNLWVHGELVKDGVAAAPKVPVRTGPGISNPSVGELKKDEKVSIRGEYREWLKIAPPQSFRLWVNRKFLDLGEKQGEKPVPVEAKSKPVVEAKPVVAEKPVVTAKPVIPEKKPANITTPVVRSKPTVKQPAPQIPNEGSKAVKKDFVAASPPVIPSGRLVDPSPESMVTNRLVSSKDQGLTVSYEGILRRSAFKEWNQPGKYRLVVSGNNGLSTTLCYVIKDEKQLSSLKDKTVALQGREYWVQGLRWPVVIPSQITSRD